MRVWRARVLDLLRREPRRGLTVFLQVAVEILVLPDVEKCHDLSFLIDLISKRKLVVLRPKFLDPDVLQRAPLSVALKRVLQDLGLLLVKGLKYAFG